MQDAQIIDGLFEKDENALKQLSERFGKLCLQVAYNVLGNREDAEECVNDAYLNVWEAIPPTRPSNLRAFVCKVTRNLSLDRVKYNSARKRSSNELISLSELDEKIGFEPNYEELGDVIDKFLRTEKPETRIIFMRRYWFLDSIEEIAMMYGYSESKIKSLLYRARGRLEKFLKKEGIDI